MVHTIISWVVGSILLGITLIAAWLYRKRDQSVNIKNPYTTFWRRFWASSVDSFVIMPFLFSIKLIAQFDLPIIITLLLFSIQSLAFISYTIYFHGKWGQTLGKRVFRVQVVQDKSQNPITYKEAVLRDGIMLLIVIVGLIEIFYFLISGNLNTSTLLHELRVGATEIDRDLRFAEKFALPWMILELITMLTNKKRRALHDYIAGTVVVCVPKSTPQHTSTEA